VVPGVGFSGEFWNLPQTARKQETGNRKQETGNRKQETGNRKQETGNRKQETGNGVAADWRRGDTVRNREWLTGWKSTTPEDPTMKWAGADKSAPFFVVFFPH